MGDLRETGHEDARDGNLLSDGQVKTPDGREGQDDEDKVVDDVGIAVGDAEFGPVDAETGGDGDVPIFIDGPAAEEDEQQANEAMDQLHSPNRDDSPAKGLHRGQPIVHRQDR